MNDADIESVLYRIFAKKIVFFYKNEQYELRSPNVDLKYGAQLLYDNIINDEKFNDWIRQEYLDNLLINLALWTPDTLKIIASIEKNMEDAKVALFQNSLVSTKCKSIRKNLHNLKIQHNKIMGHKYEMMSNTLEGYASGVKQEYIICNTLYKNNKLIFNKNTINDQNSYMFFNELLNEINKCNISMDMYKEIARHHLWRGYWNCDKNNVFPDSIIDWTEEQRSLVNVSIMYDNVYTHPECPSDSVINDDDMLDGWMIYQKRKNEKAKKTEQIDKLNPKLKNAQEVFMMSSSREEAQEIFGLNSEESLSRIKSKLNYIDQATESVAEYSLPDVQNDLQMKLRQMPRRR
jgi:hypothetical protein